MNWKTIYEKRKMTAEEAIKNIKDGERVSFSHAAAIPQLTMKALVEHAEDFHNVEIYHMLSIGPAPYVAPEMQGHFRHITNFVGANTRQAIAENRADFIPIYFHELPKLIREKQLAIDVAIVQVSEPDEEGYCSFGVSTDYTKSTTENVRLVIAEVNKQMPYIGGDNFIHVSKIDCIIEADYPLYTIPKPKIGEIEQSIGRNCASLIPDGATLQLGIGAIPDAVLLFLKDKKDLGIYTEMFSDGIIKLVESGVITNKKKNIHPNKIVGSFLMGTKELYDFVDHNPDVECYPVDYINDPAVIAQNDNMISINSCLAVDLMGQVVSESIGTLQYSGVGGQVDYVRGATMSKGGKSIIAIPSTAQGGKTSRIVPFVAQGAAVTTSRNEVDYIVTEYGVAKLKVKTLRERALALINIAHPDFRDELMQEYYKRFPESGL